MAGPEIDRLLGEGRQFIRTPAEVVRALNGELTRILALPDTMRKADGPGTGVDTMSPPQLTEVTRRELDCWGRVIRSAQMTAD